MWLRLLRLLHHPESRSATSAARSTASTPRPSPCLCPSQRHASHLMTWAHMYVFPPRCRTTSRTPSPTVQRLRTAPLAVFLQDVSRVFGLMGSLCTVAARRRYISLAGTQQGGEISTASAGVIWRSCRPYIMNPDCSICANYARFKFGTTSAVKLFARSKHNSSLVVPVWYMYISSTNSEMALLAEVRRDSAAIYIRSVGRSVGRYTCIIRPIGRSVGYIKHTITKPSFPKNPSSQNFEIVTDVTDV